MNKATAPEATYSIAQNISFETTPDGAVILEIESGQLFTCNTTAAEFLVAVDGEKSLTRISSEIAEIYDSQPSEIYSDLAEIADTYQEMGILVRSA